MIYFVSNTIKNVSKKSKYIYKKNNNIYHIIYYNV